MLDPSESRVDPSGAHESVLDHGSLAVKRNHFWGLVMNK